MTNVPKPKRQLCITQIEKTWIALVAVPDIIETIRTANVGNLTFAESLNQWTLHINPLYDLDEVVEWIRAQGE